MINISIILFETRSVKTVYKNRTKSKKAQNDQQTYAMK